uniref:PAZ domain-containing protein n=1 Tax=Panagrolaimus sp. PS1159 TaxID=55785 RepID=A0AC35FEV2_9BILA
MSSNNTPATGSNATAASNGSSSPPNERARADDRNKFGAKRQALATLSHLGLELGNSVVYDKERAIRGSVCNGDTQVNLSTNIFGLKTVACDIHLYHLEFLKVFTTGKYAGESYPFIDPERKAPDYTAFQNRQDHGKLLKAFLNKYPNVFGNDHDIFCYDYAASLYSLAELVSFDTSMFLTEQETNETIGRPYKVTLTVKKPQDNVFNVRDLTRGQSLDLSQQPLHVIRFLELVTSRHAASHPEEHVMYESKKTYYMRPENYGFNLLQLGGGKYLAAGASKTVACVEGPKNKGAAAVIIDSKKTAFFHAMNLLEMLCSAVNVKPTICIAEYFHRRYGITLNYPHWPLAIGAKKVQGNKPSFPVELLTVADYQRVGSGNITSTDIATIVKSCAVLPAIKNREITNCYRSFSFGVDAFMQKAGMSVLAEPLKIPARVLKAPQVKYANGSIYPEQNGKWRLPKQAKYAITATLKRWLAVFLIVPQERMKFGEFKQFAEKFYFECDNRGLRIDEPYGLREVVCDEHAIEELFETARKEQCEYILFGHSDRDTRHHSVIKGMERKYEVISQCVRTKTIYNVMTKSPLSLENIVAKANVKLG